MIELLFVACLSTASDECIEESLVYVEMSPMACMMAAQPELAKWTEAHPNYRIAKWRCRMVSFAERDV